MAQPHNHLSFSVILALLYSAIGFTTLGVNGEQALLSAVIIVVAGILPNIDQSGSNTAKECSTVIAAMLPLFLLQFYPELKDGGVVRITLLVIASYVFTRLVVVKYLEKKTTHRGMVHSIPAAIIASEVTYLAFWDLPRGNRAYLAVAALIGFMAHLMLDASSNLDLVGKASGKAEAKTPVLKLLAPSWGKTILLYSVILMLGFFIAKDFYPRLGLSATLTY